MQKKTLISATMAAALAACFVPPASAQSSNTGYFSGSIGGSSSNDYCTGLTSCKKSAVTGRIVGGYRVLPFLAVEAHYSPQIGYVRGSAGPVEATIKADSVGLGVAGMYSFGQLTAILRGGVATHLATYHGTISGVDVLSESQRKTQPYIGAGLNFSVNSQFDVGIAYDHDRVKIDDARSSFNAYSLVGTLKF